MRLRGWSHGLPKQIQDGGGRHLQFWKNINNSGLDKDICTTLYAKMHHGHAEIITSKSRNRKLIRVTSSNEYLQHVRRSQ